MCPEAGHAVVQDSSVAFPFRKKRAAAGQMGVVSAAATLRPSPSRRSAGLSEGWEAFLLAIGDLTTVRDRPGTCPC